MKLRMTELIVLNSISLEFSSTILNDHKINAEIFGREKTPFSPFGEKYKKKEFH